jgi:uncharacterized protein (TIGR03067 family)
MARSIFPWLIVVCCFFAPLARGADPSPKKPADARRATLEKVGYTHVPLTLDKLYFHIEGTVGTEKVKFLLDSGSQGTTLDLKLAKKLKLELGKETASIGVGGVTVGRETHIPGLRIGSFDGGQESPQIAAEAADLSVWPGVPGVLGANLLDSWGAVIDYPARAVYLRPPPKRNSDAQKPPADPLRDLLLKDGYTVVPLGRDPDGSRMVAARAGKHELRLMVDTGANVSAFDVAGLEKWGAKRFGGAEASGFGGKSKTEKVSLRGLTLGTYDTRRVWQEVYGGGIDLTAINNGLAEQKRKPISGLFGGLDLLNGSAVIDFGTNTLYLKPIKETVAPQLEGKWVGVRYELDGQKGQMDPGFASLEFKGDRFVSTQQGRTVEWAFHLEDMGDRFRIALFKAKVDELADGFQYSSAGLIKRDGDTLVMATQQSANKGIPTEFATPKGSGVLLVEFKRVK